MLGVASAVMGTEMVCPEFGGGAKRMEDSPAARATRVFLTSSGLFARCLETLVLMDRPGFFLSAFADDFCTRTSASRGLLREDVCRETVGALDTDDSAVAFFRGRSFHGT
jgi:hypothetical protein